MAGKLPKAPPKEAFDAGQRQRIAADVEASAADAEASVAAAQQQRIAVQALARATEARARGADAEASAAIALAREADAQHQRIVADAQAKQSEGGRKSFRIDDADDGQGTPRPERLKLGTVRMIAEACHEAQQHAPRKRGRPSGFDQLAQAADALREAKVSLASGTGSRAVRVLAERMEHETARKQAQRLQALLALGTVEGRKK
jgi:hypothetical protein